MSYLCSKRNGTCTTTAGNHIGIPYHHHMESFRYESLLRHQELFNPAVNSFFEVWRNSVRIGSKSMICSHMINFGLLLQDVVRSGELREEDMDDWISQNVEMIGHGCETSG